MHKLFTWGIIYSIIALQRGGAMNLYYNQNYTREQIVLVLQTVQDCVRESRFYISKNENRQENLDFIKDYNLTNKRAKRNSNAN